MEPDLVQGRKQFEGRLMMRALEDAAFREQLLKNPRAAIEEEFGEPFPSSFKLQAIEEPADTLLLVVPQLSRPSGELSDAQLEAVAGGLTMDEAWTAVKKFFKPTTWQDQAANRTGNAVAGVRG